MLLRVEPVTPERFEDFADVLNRTRRATHCWCLSHRLPPREIEELGGGSREAAARALAARPVAPGVVAYDEDGVAVGWCAVAPRTEIPRLVSSRLIRPLDDLAVWSIICVVVRSGHRRRGITTPLLEGAAQYAFDRGAPAVEAYPVDAGDERIDTTMAFVRTRSMFEKAGFTVAGATDAQGSGRPRIVVRKVAP